MIDAKKIQEISIQILRTHSGSGESRRATDHALGSHPLSKSQQISCTSSAVELVSCLPSGCKLCDKDKP